MPATDPHCASNYGYEHAGEGHMHARLWPPIQKVLRQLGPCRIVDLGSGNGFLASRIKEAFPAAEIIGIEPSESGVRAARAAFPNIRFLQGSVYDEPPPELLGSTDVVVSTEVVEHLYSPRAFPVFIKKVLRPGGTAIVTTPFHGYWKNLALVILNKWDFHHGVFWEHGHIKFWSRATLQQLFEEAGFETQSFIGIGRIPGLWMTMMMKFRLSEHSPAPGAE